MPGPPRRYATNAARQQAYRARCQEARCQEPPAPGPSRLPAIAPLPGSRRWRALIQQAHGLLVMAETEMSAYYEGRTPTWQESERGEVFLERLEALQEAQSTVAELDS